LRFGQRTSSSFNQFNQNRQYDNWINSHFWRLQTSAGYFDPYLPYLPNTWAYFDSYGIHSGSSLISQHPDWIFRDAYGNNLFIPWGCSGGTCPQYAFDFSNQGYISWWIGQAKAMAAKGYKGLWVDDVNLAMRISNGSGTNVVPIDRATNQPMTDAAWRQYFANFMTQVRQALPGVEIVHNAIWSAGPGAVGSDPSVQQEIKAADYINLERGVGDSGLTGDGSYWSVQNLFNYIDTVHRLGAKIIIEDLSNIGEYGPASYFMISSGMDAFSDTSTYPNNWPAMYDVTLGTPLGARYNWSGLMRRDFSGGMALINPPNAPAVTVTLPGTYKNTAGQFVSQITLSARQGALLVGTSSAATGGSLAGSGDSSTNAVNLTGEGGADWIHWGDSALNRKAGVSPQLGTYAVVGSRSATVYGNDLRTMSWSDGTPSGSSTNRTGLYISGVGNGFSFAAPADSSSRTLAIHVGGWNSAGTLTAHLSDGSAADFVNTTPTASGQYDRNYLLTYQAASAGQTIRVTWTVAAGSGNVTVNGAALAGTTQSQGSLTGVSNGSSSLINLTGEGTTDWIHWGDNSVIRKSSGQSRLSDYSVVGSGTVLFYGNDLRPLSWSDGAATASASANANGIYIRNSGNGFSFTAPADTTTRTLNIHVGGWNSSGKLTARLSDGSAADFTDTTSASSGQYDRNYTLTYHALSSGQNLTVTYTMAGGSGNVTLNGAALQ
jgi:hypothetical protein